MRLRVLTPDEVLACVRLMDHLVSECFPRRDVSFMHAITVPAVLWKTGPHNVGIEVLPNYGDPSCLDFIIYRACRSDAPADPSWDRCAKELSRELSRGVTLTHKGVSALKVEVADVNRRSQDARKTGFNDVYTIRVLRGEGYISLYERDLQDRADQHDPLRQAAL